MSNPLAAFCLALFCFTPDAAAQGFGKNHVRLDRFDWKVRSTDHFDIHYYDRSEPWLEKSAHYLEMAYEEGGELLGHRPKERKPFFLYATVNDMQQSNIARVGDGVGGVTEAFKDRFMVYADGSEAWLEDVIVHEYGHIIEFDILMAGFWRSARILKTFIYPLWMMEGMAEYLTGGRDRVIEDVYLRDAALHDGLIPLPRLMQFGHLKPHQVTLAYKSGGSAIRFLAEEYEKDVPKKLLETFRSRFDINSVLLEAVGTDLGTFSRKWMEYLKMRYGRQAKKEKLEPPSRYGDAVSQREDSIPAFDSSPVFTSEGRKMFFLSTREGFPPALWVRDLKRKRERRFLGRSFETLENVPLGSFTQVGRNLAISPDGRTLVFSGQKNHREAYYFVDSARGKMRRRAPKGFAQLFQASFSPDGRRLAFSGLKNGRTDIYVWNLDSGEIEALTEDGNDDRSPYFSPDGKWVVFSTEYIDRTKFNPHQRDLRRAWLEDGRVEVLTTLNGSEREPVVHPKGNRVLFIGEEAEIPEIYEMDLESGRIARLTRSTGGNFTPGYAPNGDIVFSAMFRGSARLYRGPRERFLDEEVVAPRNEARSAPAALPEPPALADAAQMLSAVQDYRFRAGTDLFLPAFFYSSQGGLFWTSFWSASDYLGDHRVQSLVVYNSGSSFLNYSLDYAYAKHRPEFIFRAQGFTTRDNFNVEGRRFDQNAHLALVGVSYPFDRYHRSEFLVGLGQNVFRFPTRSQDDFTDDVRLAQVAFVRDTVGGRYLVPTYGSRLRLSHVQAVPTLGGNQTFQTEVLEAQTYIPTAPQSALALRGVAAMSFGRDREVFELGGVGFTRGFQRSAVDNIATRFALGTAEYRFPIWSNLDYYVNFMFPDFYFKAVRGVLFSDLSVGWDRASEFSGKRPKDTLHSVGAGLRVHTFLLQSFPLVLSLDWAYKTTNGGNVWYFYVGPVF